MTQGQTQGRDWAAQQQPTAYPINLMGKLRTNIKTGKFGSEEKVIYVRKSVLLAIQQASMELNKAQEEFAAHVVDAEVGAPGHGSTGEVVLEKMAQSSPWGAFSLMEKLVDEEERGRGQGFNKMGSSRGHVDKGDWMTQLKQKKKDHQAELDNAAAAAAAKAAAIAAAAAAKAEEQDRRRAAVATISANWLAYKARRDERRAQLAEPLALDPTTGDGGSHTQRPRAHSGEPGVSRRGSHKGGEGEGSGSEDEGEECEHGTKWKKSATTHFKRAPSKRLKPAAPSLVPKEGGPGPRKAMFHLAEEEEEVEAAEKAGGKKGRRKKKKADAAGGGGEGRQDEGSEDEDEDEYSEKRVEEAFESAAHLMAIADKICDQGGQGDSGSGSGSGSGSSSKVNSPRGDGPRRPAEYEEGSEGLAAAGERSRRRSASAGGGWSGSEEGGEGEEGEEGEEEGEEGVEGQGEGEVKQKAKGMRKGRRSIHRDHSRAAQPPETPTTRTRAEKGQFAVPSDLLGAQGEMVFSRYGWVLRSELAGPMRPIDPAIMNLLKRVMAEALRARKVGENRQAMRLVGRATNLLQACLMPLMLFGPEDAAAAAAEPSVPLAIRQYVPGPDTRRRGVPWWFSQQCLEDGGEELLGRASYPSRAVGGCATAMPARMLCAMHRHQRAVLVPLMPPSSASASGAAGPSAPAAPQLTLTPTPRETSGPRTHTMPRVQGHNPGGAGRYPSPHKPSPPGATPLHPQPPATPLPAASSPASAAAGPQQDSSGGGNSRFLPPSPTIAHALAGSWSPWLQNGKSQALVPRCDPRAAAPTSTGGDDAESSSGSLAPPRGSLSPCPPTPSYLAQSLSLGPLGPRQELDPKAKVLPPSPFDGADVRSSLQADDRGAAGGAGELSQLLGALRPVSVSSSWSGPGPALPARRRNVANVERMASRAGRVGASVSTSNLTTLMRREASGVKDTQGGSPQRLRRPSRTFQALPTGLHGGYGCLPSPPQLGSGLSGDRGSPARAKTVVRLPLIPTQI